MSARSSATYKLTYFDMVGRAAPIRLLFAQAGQRYEDVRVQYPDWPALKSTLTLGALPVLEITQNGKKTTVAQSNAIERYLARKFNLAGRDELESARIDMINEQVVDIFNALTDCYKAIKFKRADSELKRVELAKLLDETVLAMLKPIETLYEENQRESGNSGYLVGREVSHADLKLICLHDWYTDKKDEILSKVPKLREHLKMMLAQPMLQHRLEMNKNMRFAGILEP
jgi:glutathione S-transferase